ncbi:hypothetical protein B566_EDAN018168 [Ephemera danica]|nr:hypothetical protein B566_EDAN018168 [Ephemera danica]
MMPNIKLQSSDGDVFEVDVEIAKCSVTIKTMLEDLVDVEIAKCSVTIKTMLEDLDDISSWDADFLKVDQGTLFELILVSNGTLIPFHTPV